MDPSSSSRSTSLFTEARRGRQQALGELLEMHRNYLHLVAASQLSPALRVRVSPSDVVQETFLVAQEAFGQFRGASERELLAWLKKLLASRVLELLDRHLGAGKRDVRRERPLPAGRRSGDSSLSHDAVFVDKQPTPSSQCHRQDEQRLVVDEIAKLPPDYRRVLALRNIEGLTFDEVAQRMQRTSPAVRMLWLRAVAALREQLHARGIV